VGKHVYWLGLKAKLEEQRRRYKRKVGPTVIGAPSGWTQDGWVPSDGDTVWMVSPNGVRYVAKVSRFAELIWFSEFKKRMRRRYAKEEINDG
jgi:hypothetical protein